MITNLPFSWFGVVLPVSWFIGRIRRRGERRRGEHDPRTNLVLAAGVLAAAGALNAAFLLCFFGNCIRYMVDFTPWFMLVASVGLLEAEARLPGRIGRNGVRATGLALALWSSVVIAASIVNFYDHSGQFPAAYRPIARVSNIAFLWLQQQRWPDYRPQEISLSLSTDRSPRQEALVSVIRDGKTQAVVFVDYLDDDKIRLGYEEPDAAVPVVFSPPLAAPPGAVHTLRLSIGGTYSEFDGRKGWLRAQFDPVPLWGSPVVSFGVYPGKLMVGAGARAGTKRAGFTGVVNSRRAITMPALPRVEGIRARITFAPEMAGRSLPLISTGQTMAGDLLFVSMHEDGKVTFGYDHWADRLRTSPEITVAPGETRVVEFWVPALAPPGRKPELVVKVDGVTIWRKEAPAFECAPENVFLGSNPIGGTTCEIVLENGVFEALQLPAP
jgi:hypothetical protein